MIQTLERDRVKSQTFYEGRMEEGTIDDNTLLRILNLAYISINCSLLD